jgi:transcriptional regulator GlxA family with amidase domain
MDQDTATTVKDSATVARILSYMKDNRTEMIGLIILAHLLGLSDRVLGQLNGVCF